MSCYAVWAKKPNKQLHVHYYDFTDTEDRKRALKLALRSATDMHNAGTPCVVEQFHTVEVGTLVFDTEKDHAQV